MAMVAARFPWERSSVFQIEVVARGLAGLFVPNIEIVGILAPRPQYDLGRCANGAEALHADIVGGMTVVIDMLVVVIAEVISVIERGAGDLDRFGACGSTAHITAMPAVAIDGGRGRSGGAIFIFGIAGLAGSSFGTGRPITRMDFSNSKKLQNRRHAIRDALPRWVLRSDAKQDLAAK